MIRRALRCTFTVGMMGGLLLGCDRGESSPPADIPETPEPTAKAPPPLTALTFPAELRASYPKVSTFLDEILGAWLAGDYEGYRRLVSRAYAPEPRDRFEAIRDVTEAVTVESIEPVETTQLPNPAYRVVLSAELSAEHQARRGEKRRKLAIVVFKESGQWRMATAPAAHQPQNEPPPATSSAPTTSAPAYPWDEEGDY
jgi:hypothetical protein